jgi:hypothetical protein
MRLVLQRQSYLSEKTMVGASEQIAKGNFAFAAFVTNFWPQAHPTKRIVYPEGPYFFLRLFDAPA